MHPHDGLSIGLAIVSLLILSLLNGFFTLAESALVTIRNARLEQVIAERGSDAAAAGELQELLRRPTRVVATVQVGITLAAFAVSAIAAAVLAPHLAHLFHRWGVPHDTRVATVVLALVAALLTIVVGELVPRAVAQRSPERVALLVARPFAFFEKLFAGLASVALGLSNLLVKPFGLTATFAAPVITETELRTLLEASARSGAIEEDEKEMIRSVISFGDTDVRQVMTPRVEIKAADIGTGLAGLLQLIVESGHSRIPVYEGSIDMIVGSIHAKDLLPVLARGQKDGELRPFVRPPLFVSENKRVDDLLDEFRRSSLQIAIVQDEYGGTAGLVTIEDLLEEIVGEIADEYDSEEARADPPREDLSSVDGRTSISDVNERLGLSLSEADFETIGGYVFGLFGRQPGEGEVVTENGVEFLVTKTDGRRVQEVRILKRDEGGETEASA